MPPIYWSTGIQYFRASLSKGDFSSLGEQNLKKYHEESTKVSNVSVSLIAGFPVDFSEEYFQVGWVSNGFPLEFKSISDGRTTGSSLLSTGTTLPSSKYIIGIGQPQ